MVASQEEQKRALVNALIDYATNLNGGELPGRSIELQTQDTQEEKHEDPPDIDEEPFLVFTGMERGDGFQRWNWRNKRA